MTRWMFALAMTLAVGPVWADEAPPMAAVTGSWLTEGASAIVDIQPCAEDTAKLCGDVTWVWDYPEYVGTKTLGDFVYDPDDGEWTDGTIFDPEDGDTYRGRFWVHSEDRLELRGCLLMFCRSQIWIRPQVLKDALP